MRLPLVSRIVTDLLDVLFPARCPGCGETIPGGDEERGLICEACIEAMRQVRLEPRARVVEGLPVIAACAYEPPLTALVPAAKSTLRPVLLEPLAGELMTVLSLAGLAEYAEILVPVPLHPARLRERGYNQAEVLARLLGQVLERPVAARALKRVANTPPQKQAGRRERLQAIEGAFAVGPEGERVRSLRVLLIDDVVTTGATLAAARRALAALKPVGVLAAAVAMTILSKTRY